jgi:hypothetical protein
MIGTFYSIHVRRKTREWQTELAVKQGDPPQRGEVIEVNLQGEKVKTRVMRITKNMNKAKGQLTVEIHAEEI